MLFLPTLTARAAGILPLSHAALPGLIATTDSWHAVYGSAEFLRAWAAQPGFRLVK
ncbi:DUF6368 family protein [Nonomuraea phyllanthi]|uniref:DUF6368 family protein n=1 Tax=Nonomuraea phyllanthi TaxID=2219224 RepID=UPI001D008479